MQVKDLSAGDNIEVIELAVKNVGQGKLGKPPNNTPYQHLWLTDGTGDIRFSLFGEDVNKIQQGQTVKIISAYVKEYPVGSGKLQLALGRDGGDWQIVSGGGQPIKRDDIVAAPVQIVSSDARDERISKLACLKAAAQLYQGCWSQDIAAAGNRATKCVIQAAAEMYEWVMGEQILAEKPPEPKSEDKPKDSPVGTGPQATKLKLIGDAALKEKAGWTGPPSPELIQKFAPVMNGILGGDKERHTWLKWTYGEESSKDVTGAKLQAVLDFLEPTYTDKKWIPTQNAELIKAMFKQALIDAGQAEMPLEEAVEELYGPEIPF